MREGRKRKGKWVKDGKRRGMGKSGKEEERRRKERGRERGSHTGGHPACIGDPAYIRPGLC